MKIKAYTLMEVTVAMLLSAICISICYTAYSIIGTYYNSFHEKNQSADQAISLRHALESDFMKSSLVLKTADGFQLIGDTNKIYYSFNEAGILRNLMTIHTDTFKLQSKDLKGYFENKEVMDLDTIDQISFSLFLDRNTVTPIQVHKYYSAKDLFK